jgi:hypothetical protein
MIGGVHRSALFPGLPVVGLVPWPYRVQSGYPNGRTVYTSAAPRPEDWSKSDSPRESAGAGLAQTRLSFPAFVLGIAAAEGEDGIRETLARFVGRVDAYQNGAVSAALNIAGVRFHTQL